MSEALQRHWNEASHHEAAKDLPAARAGYEAMLAIEPKLVAPNLRLSRLAQIADRYVEARDRALQASHVCVETQDAKSIGFVSLRLLAFAEDGEIVRLIRSMDWIRRDVLQQSAVLAQHLWLVDQHELALEFLTHVGTRVKPSPLLCYTRANVLRSLGMLDEAVEYYEYALRLDPHNAYVHRTLAFHQASRPAGSRVPRLEAARRHHAEGSAESAQLCYALFKELDAADQTEAAWQALQEGAAAVRRTLRHDREEEARGFERLLHSSPWKKSPTASAVSGGPVPIFIVGMPRTGTTLLDRVLGNHAEVVSLGERNDFDAAISEVSNHFYKGGLRVSQWTKLLAADPALVGERYLERLAPRIAGHHCFIDKNPKNFFNVGLILRALPQARIICVRRDPMDACFSNLKELFEGGAYPYSYAFEDLAAHHRGFVQLMAHWQASANGSVHIVDYEALVRVGDETLHELLAFCGLAPAKGLLDITANASPVSTASSSQVRSPIHDRGVGAWRRYALQLEPLRVMLEARRTENGA
ncbi:tetratricopeptide repeat-containing sulfotransferase family protein [Pseudoxanthomonas japonensis]|nr:sulfotransferase [Pseudoxanthomonas japonensis]